jgi:hypothetical protein
LVAGQSRADEQRRLVLQKLDRKRRALLFALDCNFVAQQVSHFDILGPGMYQVMFMYHPHFRPAGVDVVDLCTAEGTQRFHIVRDPITTRYYVLNDERPEDLSNDFYDLFWASGGRIGQNAIDALALLLLEHKMLPPWVRGIDDVRRMRRLQGHGSELLADVMALNTRWCEGCEEEPRFPHRHADGDFWIQ